MLHVFEGDASSRDGAQTPYSTAAWVGPDLLNSLPDIVLGGPDLRTRTQDLSSEPRESLDTTTEDLTPKNVHDHTWQQKRPGDPSIVDVAQAEGVSSNLAGNTLSPVDPSIAQTSLTVDPAVAGSSMSVPATVGPSVVPIVAGGAVVLGGVAAIVIDDGESGQDEPASP